jgi:hypothetical protein
MHSDSYPLVEETPEHAIKVETRHKANHAAEPGFLV